MAELPLDVRLETDYGSGDDETGFQADLHDWIKGQVEKAVELHHGFKAGFDNGGEAVSEMQSKGSAKIVLVGFWIRSTHVSRGMTIGASTRTTSWC